MRHNRSHLRPLLHAALLAPLALALAGCPAAEDPADVDEDVPAEVGDAGDETGRKLRHPDEPEVVHVPGLSEPIPDGPEGYRPPKTGVVQIDGPAAEQPPRKRDDIVVPDTLPEVTQLVRDTAPVLDSEPKRPPPPSSHPPGSEWLQQQKVYRAQKAQWDKAVATLAAAGERYLAQVEGGTGDPLVLHATGAAAARLADAQSQSEARTTRELSADLLRTYLTTAPGDDSHRAGSEATLGRVLLLIGEADGVEQGLGHLQSAVPRLLEQGDRDAAGVAAYYLLHALVSRGREKEAAEAADVIDAATADFGGATPRIRGLARRAAVAPGNLAPEFPADVVATDGKRLTLADYRGKVTVLHFFQAGLPTGHATEAREVDSVLVPLHERWNQGGLELVGVSLDLALTPERVKQIEANWEEWGTSDDETVHDGSQAAVASWFARQGATWRWHWDGKWSKNVVAQAYGITGPYAIVIDRDGRIVWRGAPHVGLTEVVDELMADGK